MNNEVLENEVLENKVISAVPNDAVPKDAVPNANFITRETMQRLLKDVRQIIKFPLTDNGIYYSHEDTDMLK
jgi:hypothetical protein